MCNLQTLIITITIAVNIVITVTTISIILKLVLRNLNPILERNLQVKLRYLLFIKKYRSRNNV